MKNKSNNDSIKSLENDFSNLPHVYANTFSAELNSTDLGLVLGTNGVRKCTVNLPYSTAKTLAHALNELLENYEKVTNQQILSAIDLHNLFKIAKET